jgi:hypothetical protein
MLNVTYTALISSKRHVLLRKHSALMGVHYVAVYIAYCKTYCCSVLYKIYKLALTHSSTSQLYTLV